MLTLVFGDLTADVEALCEKADDLIVDRVRTAPRIAGYSYIDAPRYEFADDAAEQNRLGELCRKVKADAFASTYYSIAAGVLPCGWRTT